MPSAALAGATLLPIFMSGAGQTGIIKQHRLKPESKADVICTKKKEGGG